MVSRLSAWWLSRRQPSDAEVHKVNPLEKVPADPRLSREIKEEIFTKGRGTAAHPAPQGGVPWPFLSEYEYNQRQGREDAKTELAELEPCIVEFYEMHASGPCLVRRRAWRKRNSGAAVESKTRKAVTG